MLSKQLVLPIVWIMLSPTTINKFLLSVAHLLLTQSKTRITGLYIGILLATNNGLANNSQILWKIKKKRDKTQIKIIEWQKKNKKINKDKVRIQISKVKCNNKFMEMSQHAVIWLLVKKIISYIYLAVLITETNVIMSYLCLICKNISGRHLYPNTHLNHVNQLFLLFFMIITCCSMEV